MQNAVCADGRARGMFQFYGANRRPLGGQTDSIAEPAGEPHDTSGRREKTCPCRRLRPALGTVCDSVPEVLSELIRTAFVPRDGYKFIVSDFSAIEARVLSFLAGESWRPASLRKTATSTVPVPPLCSMYRWKNTGRTPIFGKRQRLPNSLRDAADR